MKFQYSEYSIEFTLDVNARVALFTDDGTGTYKVSPMSILYSYDHDTNGYYYKKVIKIDRLGTYKFKAVALDDLGNQGTSHEQTLNVACLRPEIPPSFSGYRVSEGRLLLDL